MMKNQTIVIDTPEGINFAHLLALKGALRLESLGLKRRGQSALTIYKRHYNPKCRTIKAALAEMEQIIAEARG
jgi:hypothetical protein